VPARGGDDAEGAAVAAAVLHFEVGASLVSVEGEGERGEFGMREGVVVEDGAERNPFDSIARAIFAQARLVPSREELEGHVGDH
jgi:hypothetical protein